MGPQSWHSRWRSPKPRMAAHVQKQCSPLSACLMKICGHAPASKGAKYIHPTVDDMAEAMKLIPRYACPCGDPRFPRA